MEKEAIKKEILWGLFVEFWDDELVVGGRKNVFINARTLRVFQRVFGAKLVSDCLGRWEAECSIKILGKPDALDPDAPCVQVKDYVSNIL